MDLELNIQIDPAEGVYAAPAGNIDADGFIALFRSIFAHADFVKDMNILCDLSAAQPVNLNYRSLRRINSFNLATHGERGDGRMALVVSSDLGYGLSRMAMAIGSATNGHLNLRVFRSVDHAKAWFSE